MRVYYFVGYVLRPFALISLFVYSFLLHTPRVRVVLMNEENEVLLVQSWLGGGKWELPGGGIHASEAPDQALLRELEEETGIRLQREDVQPLCTMKSMAHDEIAFWASTAKSSLPPTVPNKFEIKAAMWFPMDNLPLVAPLVERIMSKIETPR